ncbi:MAG: hypothetical protein ACI4C1_07365 [Lachnospiraceae bacterium]
MKRYLQKYALIIFFCSMMGGIIMADCLFAVAFTNKERGIAVEFSEHTKKISILQADSQDSFQQKELADFLKEYTNETSMNVSKSNSQNGVELYSNQQNIWSLANDEYYGIWLRNDQYDDWSKTAAANYYYKGNYYKVMGSYSKRLAKETFVVDMRGELNQNPQTAVKGIYYLDAEEHTNFIYDALAAKILSKNPYAQIMVLEDHANGYLGSRLLQSTDATYYLLQMSLLVLLNLFNFGNIAGYWVNARKQEILVRKMVGGTVDKIFLGLAVPFTASTGLFILIGMSISMIVIGLYTKITSEAIILGGIISLAQWILLIIFESISLCKQIHIPIMKIKKQY